MRNRRKRDKKQAVLKRKMGRYLEVYLQNVHIKKTLRIVKIGVYLNQVKIV